MRRAVVPATVASALAVAYLWPLRGYGLQVEDEGTLLAQIARVAAGQVPYVDFNTGYTPGFFYLAAGVWRLGGNQALRAALVMVHALAVGGLALLAAQLARPVFAIVVALAYLVFIPVFPGEFAAAMIPYPAWVVVPGWTAVAFALLRFQMRNRRGWLVVAGAAAAVDLAIKPNAGVFALAAAIATLLGREDGVADAPRATAAVWLVLWAGTIGGACVVLGLPPKPLDAGVFLLPIVAGMAALPTRARLVRRHLPGDVMAVVIPFGALTLPWLALFWWRLGTGRFVRDVVQIGSGAVDAFYAPHPLPERWGLALTALAIAFVVLGWLLRRRAISPTSARTALAVPTVAGAVGLAFLARMPEGLGLSVAWQLQQAAFALTLATDVAAVAWLWQSRRTGKGAGPAAIALCGMWMHLQLFPRADFTHLVGAAPLAAVFAVFLLERAVQAWERVVPPAGLAVAAVAMIALGFGGRGWGQVATAAPRYVPSASLGVGVEASRAGDLRALSEAATELERLRAPDDAGFAFPAEDVALLIAGLRNPTAHSYFYPGSPDHFDEAQVADRLALAPPVGLIALNREYALLDGANAYFFLLRRFARERYRLALRSGRYDVLARVGSAEDRGSATSLAASPSGQGTAELLAAATGPEPAVRTASLDALLSDLARERGEGLERLGALQGYDGDHRLLLVRAVRDLRDVRAASFLFAAAAAADARLAADALRAMDAVRAELLAGESLWAGAEPPSPIPGEATVRGAVRTTLESPDAPPRAVAFSAVLAGRLDDRAVVPALRARLAAGTPHDDATSRLADATATSAAAHALVRLAPSGLACTLVSLLDRPERVVRELVPSGILALADGAEPARSEARGCLLAAVDRAGPAQADAIWLAACVADGRFAGPLRSALALDRPAEVRRAAAWALGELPSDDAIATALAAAAADRDDLLREIARGAIAKQTGAVPRVWTARAIERGAAATP